ncbi:MAG: hypothetical protein ABIO70_33460 [Pseudomonadota bacterium]
MSRALALFTLLLAACPDPTNAPPAAQLSPGDAVSGAGGTDASGQPITGAPGPATTTDAKVEPGEGVVISGAVAYDGTKTGRIRLDVLAVQASGPPMLAKTLELPAFGDWSVELPKEFGAVRVVGFLDQTGDGPTPDDPAAAVLEPLQIGTEPIEGVTLTLTDDPDLGLLTPNSPPPDADPNKGNSGDGDGIARPIEGGPGSPRGPAGEVPPGQPADAPPPVEPAPDAPAEGDPS